MAERSVGVSTQVTDAVSAVGVMNVGQAPAIATNGVYMATSQGLGNSAHNGTTAQQNANTVLEAATMQGIALLYGISTASLAAATVTILDEPRKLEIELESERGYPPAAIGYPDTYPKT